MSSVCGAVGVAVREVIADVLRAKYFCTGMLDIAKYSHYSLNTPVYTHFTVSHLVHRI
jgi:exoribonuclease R